MWRGQEEGTIHSWVREKLLFVTAISSPICMGSQQGQIVDHEARKNQL